MIHKGYAYLAGPLTIGAEANRLMWRSIGTKLLYNKGYKVHYPYDNQRLKREELSTLRKDDFDTFKKEVAKIVTNDLNLLSQSKIMVCLISSDVLKGAGTISEITYAYRKNIPVYAFIDLPRGIDDVPSWLCGCITEHAHTIGTLINIIPELTFEEAWGTYDDNLLCDY